MTTSWPTRSREASPGWPRARPVAPQDEERGTESGPRPHLKRPLRTVDEDGSAIGPHTWAEVTRKPSGAKAIAEPEPAFVQPPTARTRTEATEGSGAPRRVDHAAGVHRLARERCPRHAAGHRMHSAPATIQPGAGRSTRPRRFGSGLLAAVACRRRHVRPSAPRRIFTWYGTVAEPIASSSSSGSPMARPATSKMRSPSTIPARAAGLSSSTPRTSRPSCSGRPTERRSRSATWAGAMATPRRGRSTDSAAQRSTPLQRRASGRQGR